MGAQCCLHFPGVPWGSQAVSPADEGNYSRFVLSRLSRDRDRRVRGLFSLASPPQHDVLEFRPGCHVYQEFVSYIHLYLFNIPNHTVFIHLPLEGLLGSFQCLAAVNGVAVNILCAGLCVDGSFRFSRADTQDWDR